MPSDLAVNDHLSNAAESACHLQSSPRSPPWRRSGLGASRRTVQVAGVSEDLDLRTAFATKRQTPGRNQHRQRSRRAFPLPLCFLLACSAEDGSIRDNSAPQFVQLGFSLFCGVTIPIRVCTSPDRR